MKKLFILFCVAFTHVSYAQTFQSDWEKAQQISNTKDRLLMLVFSGSDWCGPCIKLDKEVWQNADFEAFAEDNLVIYKADFPRKKANKLPEDLHNLHKELAATYNPNGYFPLVVFIHKDVVVGQMGYEKIGGSGYIVKIRNLLP